MGNAPCVPRTGQGSASLPFRQDLEGLRGLAILLVVAYHARVPGFTGGYVGVDVFFVLSGYLITSLLVQKFDATGRIHFAEFYAGRARRLLPAAAIVLSTTVLVSRFVYAPFEQQNFTGTAVATAAYVSNMWFTTESLNYWAPDSAANPFLHTWSLSVEEQFYLVWPLLLAAALYFGHSRSRRRRLAVIMGVAATVSFAASVRLTTVAQPLAFFSSPARAWEFAVGGLGALFTAQVQQRDGRFASVLAWTGLAAICGSAVWFGETTAFPGIAALAPVVGTVVVLTQASTAAPGSHTRILSGPLPQWFGRLSYSWYLWHWPVLLIVGAVAGSTRFRIRGAAMALALLLAWVTFLCVEHPIRSSKALARRPRLSLGLAAGVTAISLSVAWHARTLAARDSDTPVQRSLASAREDGGPTGCLLGTMQSTLIDCAVGDTNAGTTIVLFGDSHAFQWLPAMEPIAKERHWKLVALTKAACPAAAIEPFDTVLGRPYVECTQWRTAAIDRIKALHPLAVVMASSSRLSAADSRGVPRAATADQWFTGTLDTVSTFRAAGLTTVLMADTPWPEFEVPACLGRAAWNPSLSWHGCSFERDTALKPAFYAAETRAISRTPGASMIDLNDGVCDASVCQPTRGEVVVYRDTNHLTATFARSLAPRLAAMLDAAWGMKPLSSAAVARQ